MGLWEHFSQVKLLQLGRSGGEVMFLCHGWLLSFHSLIISVCALPLSSHLHSQDAKDNEEGTADDHDVADGLQ